MPAIPISLTITGDTASSVVVETLVRGDTNATPGGVTLPIALTNSGSAWSGTFTDSTPPAWYYYTYRIAWSDGTVEPDLSGTLAGSGNISGYYTDLTTAQFYAGQYNIAIFSNKNNDTLSVDPNSVTLCLGITDSEMNGGMRGGPFTVPLVGGGEAGLPFPMMVQHVATCIFIYHLAVARGFFDKDPSDPTASKIKPLYKWALGKLAAWKGGIEQLPCARRWPTPTAPVGV